ncbi:hypothetical protein D6D54_04390 [Spiroplasma poulsonii]|uniref:Uncharacterized protein n=1 Tax=Spiroplasma poulsonii TaxID=2138 RepID=A0A433ERF3_9MOLU|nr:hypothetical protein [Spiroplasma poulsonii]RUP77175.1 hypothetical protein D6D54_04390 [Spiroplasma poulsonii]
MQDGLEKQLDHNLKGSEQAMFDALLKSYYLDDDQLDYLHKYYRPIFTFANDEDCICLSKQKYETCCKPKVLNSQKKREEYISILQAVGDPTLKEAYLQQETTHYQRVLQECANQTCILQDCNNKVAEHHLYPLNTSKNCYFLDRYHSKHFFKNIKTPFLDITGEGQVPYAFNVFCQNHLNEYLVQEKELSPQLAALLININDNLIDHQEVYQTYLAFYHHLSVAEQVILTLKLRRIMKLHLIYELELYRLINDLDNKNRNYVVKKIILPKEIHTLTWNDILLAQLTPITFQAINSPNNPFLPNKILYSRLVKHDKNGEVHFIYHKNNRIFNTYFTEWEEKIKNEKQWQNFISSLIINQGTHFLIDKKYYDKLNQKTKELINIYYYNRFEQPRNSAEELMLQTFINNFNNGINILK